MQKLMTILVLVAAAAWTSGAGAQVQIAVATSGTGNDLVEIQFQAALEGGSVTLPAGTLVSTGDLSQQDLVLGETIEADLAPGETRTVSVPAYCIHSSRSVPNVGVAMRTAGDAESGLQRLMAVDHLFPHTVMQQAVWAYRNGEPSGDEHVNKVFIVAGVVVK